MNTGLRCWLSKAGAWGASRYQCLKVYRALVAAYCANTRHYHDLTHIEHMFGLVNEVEMQIEDKSAFFFAIWFHDAIQKIGRDSEALSAGFARQQLIKLGAPLNMIKQIEILILATKNEACLSDKKDAQLLKDIDLSILGSQREQYAQYAENCRKEYAIPDFLYQSGRRSVLQRFLSQAYIFQTDVLRTRFEQQARDNLQWELGGKYA